MLQKKFLQKEGEGLGREEPVGLLLHGRKEMQYEKHLHNPQQQNQRNLLPADLLSSSEVYPWLHQVQASDPSSFYHLLHVLYVTDNGTY